MEIKLETFKDIYDLTLSRINIEDQDDQIERIVKSGLNEAYKQLGKIDKRINTAYVPIINGVATLPDDIDSIESITPPIGQGDRKVGNSIITSKTGLFTVIYSYIREPLTQDADTPELNPKYFHLMSTYACYDYYNYKKKGPIAQDFLQQYMKGLDDLKERDNLTYRIENVFAYVESDY